MARAPRPVELSGVLATAAMAGALLAAERRLRELGSRGAAVATLATFAGAGIFLPHLFLSSSAALAAALVLAGLALTLRGRGGARDPGTGAISAGPVATPAAAWTLPAGSACLGLAVVAEPLAAPLALAPLLVAGSSRRRLVAAGTLAVAIAAGVALDFAAGGGSPLAGVVPVAAPRWDSAAWSALYAAVGRHTGIFVYLPTAAVLLVWMLRSPRRRDPLLLGLAAACVAMVIALRTDQLAGPAGDFLGGRALLIAYPAVLMALRALPPRRVLTAAWALAAVVLLSAIASLLGPGAADRSAQAHARAGVFRLLPYETTAATIDGDRDSWWNGDLVRFTDEGAALASDGFELAADGRETELMIASTRPEDRVGLLVASPLPEVRLRWRDWGQQRELVLAGSRRGTYGLAELELSPALRLHQLPHRPGEPHSVRVLTIAAAGPPGASGGVQLQYLGDLGTSGGDVFGFQALRLVMPGALPAGQSLVLPLELRNTGRFIWHSGRRPPFALSYRLYPEPLGVRAPLEGPRTRLRQPVAPGEVVELGLRFRTPQTPGRYWLAVDPLLEGVAWFEDQRGEPLAAGWLEVMPCEVVP